MKLADVYKALADRLSRLDGIEWTAQRDLAMDECKHYPALICVPGQMAPMRSDDSPLTVWRCDAHVGVVVRVSGETDAYGKLLPLVDTVRAALMDMGPGPSVPTTLGGVVDRCWISGEVEILGGAPGESFAAARIPIELLVTE